MEAFIYILLLLLILSPKDIFSLLREGEKEKEILVAFLYVFWLVLKPATWVCVLTWNQTCDLLVNGTVLQPTEPYRPGQGAFKVLRYVGWNTFPVLQWTEFGFFVSILTKYRAKTGVILWNMNA